METFKTILKDILHLMMISFIISLCYISVANAMTYDQILSQAKPHLPIFKQVVYTYWPQSPNQQYFPGLVEQETCSNLTNCWNPDAQLKTSREYGFGFGQVTVAYGAHGKVRFNNFTEAKERYKELAAWQWDDRYNSKYQFTFIVLEIKNLFVPIASYFKDDINRWAATLVSYNAGSRTILDRIAACAATRGCDKAQWFNGLNTVALPYEKKLLYGVPLYERRNEYPENIINIRSPKYLPPWDAIVLNDEGAVVSINTAQPPLQSAPQQPEAPLPAQPGQPTQTAQNTVPQPAAESIPSPINPAYGPATDTNPSLFTLMYNALGDWIQYLKTLFN